MTTPDHPRAVHHLAVCVKDLRAAEDFYVGILGLSVRERHRRSDGSLRSIWLDLGDAFLAVEQVHGGPLRADASPGWHCVALAIDASAREAWIAHLAACGHPVERTSDYTLYVRDPEGSLVALSHYPQRRAGEGC